MHNLLLSYKHDAGRALWCLKNVSKVGVAAIIPPNACSKTGSPIHRFSFACSLVDKEDRLSNLRISLRKLL